MGEKGAVKGQRVGGPEEVASLSYYQIGSLGGKKS